MKRSIKIAATTAVAVSSAILVKKAKENKVEEKENTYRNTELGKHDKNSKGIYYTNGNYEAFARTCFISCSMFFSKRWTNARKEYSYFRSNGYCWWGM